MSNKYGKSDNNITQRKSKPSVIKSPQSRDGLEPAISQLIKQEIRLAIREGITEEFGKIKKDMTSFKGSLKFINAQYDALHKTVLELRNEAKNLKGENDHLQKTIKILETKVLMLEQESYQWNLEIQCLPEYKHENLAKILQQVSKVISFPITENDIKSLSRVRKQDQKLTKPQTVICKSSNRLQRDNFLVAILRYNKSHPNDKLNYKLLELGDNSSPTYICEHLTKTNRQVHAATRIKAKEKQYKYIWVRSGKIFIRKDENSCARIITHKEFLQSIT